MVWPISLRPFVKFWWGLISTLATADVRFAPDSDRIADIAEGPLCAKSGCEQSQQGSPLFDQLVRQQLH